MEQFSPVHLSPTPLVLIVDDDLNMRFFLRVLLEKDGYTVTEADDGAQALSIYERLQPDLILLDAMMPIMDGFTACRQLRLLPGGEYIPILMVTALKEDEAIDRAFEVGATDYIVKPVHKTVLRQRVRHLLRAKKTEDALRQSLYLYQTLIVNHLGQPVNGFEKIR
ncbi:MAG: response regulator [Anaerolineae bacterium]|nr:response regulator [Anaerolineae bacterium]